MTRLLRKERPERAREPESEPAGPKDGADPAEAAQRADGTAEGSDASAGSDAPAESDASAGSDASKGSDASPESDASGTEEPDADEAPARGPRSRSLRRAALAAGAAVLVLAGGGFFHGAHQLRSAPSAENTALSDVAATTRVAGDVGNDLARVFSYTPDGLDATERSARSVLTGKAARQYTELVGRIRADVAKQRVTLSTQAVRVGVIELHGDEARLLVFLDQVSRRDKGKAAAAAAQLTVTAQREDDQWRIVDIQTR
ncbi:hypothetical protein [Streptomyces sp. NPDC021356]|uniref:hypothetical protein n=1 Tax=Streptomyces sp. NPDC021356 TaxID=3154900 RepID=UPI00340DD7C3